MERSLAGIGRRLRRALGVSAGLRRDHVVDAFGLVLGRAPEEAAIADHLRLPHRAALFEHLLRSAEFRARVAPRPPAAEAPPAHPAPVFLGDRVLAYTRAGMRIFLVPGDVDVTPHVLFNGTWEGPVEQVVARQLRPGQAVVDLGANVGCYTLVLAAGVGPTGTVHSFEANPELVRLLRATVFVNDLGGRVQVAHAAVLDRSGTVTLMSEPEHFGSGNLLPETLPAGYAEAYTVRATVPALRLDDALADVPALHLLRMDIEGSEPLALMGAEALVRRSPDLRVVMEWAVHMMAVRSDFPAFLTWFTGLGFRFWRICPDASLQPVSAADAAGLPHCEVIASRTDTV